ARARPAAATPPGEPVPRGRHSVRGRRLPLRPADLPPLRAAVAGGARHRQARREDGRHGPRRAHARPRPARGRRRHGPRPPRAAHDVTSGLNPYRVLVSDLVLTASDDVAQDVEALGKPVLRFELRLRPVEPLAGRRVALFTTGPAPFEHLDADVVSESRNLADRAALAEDLRGVDADVFLVELKAAAIDVVAEAAQQRGAALVLADNEVLADGLDEAVRALVSTEVPA